jgi:hypothetical protein
LLAFVSFFAIAWGGLISTWLIYKNYTAKDQVASRGWALLVIALMSLGVATLANSLGSLSYFQDDQFAETEAFLSAEDTDGLVRSSSPDDIEMDTLDHSDELLGDGRQEVVTGLSPPEGTSHNHSAVVSLEEKTGRPTVHQMLKFVDSARNPGVFTCGPHSMMYDIREQTKEKCLLRIQHCIRGASDHIALYEEAFEM